MRSAAAFFLLSFTAMVSSAAATFPATDAATHAGETGTVIGVLSNVHKGRGSLLFLDIGGVYPDNVFSGVLFMHGPDINFDSLVGKTLAITGKIKMYHGKPEIIIDSAAQVGIARPSAGN